MKLFLLLNMVKCLFGLGSSIMWNIVMLDIQFGYEINVVIVLILLE